MNIRHKILAIFILTLLVVVGGGYAYYSLIKEIQKMDEEYVTDVYYQEPTVIPRVNLGNVNPKKVRRNTKDNAPLVVPDTGRKLPSEGTVGGIGASSSGTLQGFGGYSYRKRTIESTGGGGGGMSGGGMMAYGGGSRSGGDYASGGYSSGGTMMSGTSSLLVPRTKPTTPPTTGGGIILVDPGTYTTPGEEVGNPIPVGEGWWILMLLALGYGAINSAPATRRKLKSEE